MTALMVRCIARTKAGKDCKNWAIKGATVCRKHGGSAPQVKAKAAIRAELFSWGLTDQHEDPGEILLRLVAQSASRCRLYASEVEQLVENSPSLKEALVADIWIKTDRGDEYKAGEYIRGLAKLEAEERDRCAGFCTKAIAAGLAARQVALAEKQGEIFAKGIKAILDKLGLTEAQAAMVPGVIEATVLELSAG
jgi:hypothetical protein